jgi:hypothetical protein
VHIGAVVAANGRANGVQRTFNGVERRSTHVQRRSRMLANAVGNGVQRRSTAFNGVHGRWPTPWETPFNVRSTPLSTANGVETLEAITRCYDEIDG